MSSAPHCLTSLKKWQSCDVIKAPLVQTRFVCFSGSGQPYSTKFGGDISLNFRPDAWAAKTRMFRLLFSKKDHLMETTTISNTKRAEKDLKTYLGLRFLSNSIKMFFLHQKHVF